MTTDLKQKAEEALEDLKGFFHFENEIAYRTTEQLISAITAYIAHLESLAPKDEKPDGWILQRGSLDELQEDNAGTFRHIPVGTNVLDVQTELDSLLKLDPNWRIRPVKLFFLDGEENEE